MNKGNKIGNKMGNKIMLKIVRSANTPPKIKTPMPVKKSTINMAIQNAAINPTISNQIVPVTTIAPPKSGNIRCHPKMMASIKQIVKISMVIYFYSLFRLFRPPQIF